MERPATAVSVGLEEGSHGAREYIEGEMCARMWPREDAKCLGALGALEGGPELCRDPRSRVSRGLSRV